MLKGTVFHVGDVVSMKGMDFGMKCCGCGHFVMISRTKFEKAVKAIVKSAQ